MLHSTIGRRETGKTTLVMFLARLRLEVPRLVFDPRDGISPRAGVKVYSLDELIDGAYPMLLDREISEIVYTPRDDDDLGEAFAAWSTLVQACVREHAGGLVVVIDEAALVKEDLENRRHPMQAAMRWSRRDRFHFFLTCHRPADLPTNTRAISDYLIFFHTTQEHDLSVIADRCSAEFAGQVERLEPYRFLVWNDQTGVTRQPTIAPHEWRVSLAPLEGPRPPAWYDRQSSIDAGNLWGIGSAP